MGAGNTLLIELRRRRVFRSAGLYVVGGWVVLQVADLAFESFSVPDTALRFVWFALVAGFPIAMLLAWRYKFSAQGISRTPPAMAAETVDLSLAPNDYLILGALTIIAVVAIGGFVAEIGSIGGQGRLGIYANDVEQNSIAVLPLDNLSGDVSQSYLSAGMHDALITSLSKISSLRVTSRTTSLRVGQNLSVPQIGAVLGVANVIEGSVTREGNRIRIIVQLIDAATDEHIWAESYEREMTSVLAVQSEMARAIAAAVQVRLSPEDERLLAVAPKVNPETYDAYLRGTFQLHKETRQAYRRGIGILTEAVENDPGSALAYAALAYGYSKLGHSPYPVKGAYPRAKDAALKALEIDDTLAEAHLALGMYRIYYEWDWARGETALLRAIDLNPSLEAAHYHYAWYLELFHRTEAALAAGERTKVLAPLSPFYSAGLAQQYLSAGMPQKAIDEARETLELSPDYPVAWLVLGDANAILGRYDDAIDAHLNLADSYFWSWALGYTYALAGRRDDAVAVAESIEVSADNSIPLVLINAALRNDEEVFL